MSSGPYLSYDGDRDLGFAESMRADQPTISKALATWKMAFRLSSAVLRNKPDVEDYTYNTDLKIYEAKPDLDWVMQLESESDGDSFYSFAKYSDEEDNKGEFHKGTAGRFEVRQ